MKDIARTMLFLMLISTIANTTALFQTHCRQLAPKIHQRLLATRTMSAIAHATVQSCQRRWLLNVLLSVGAASFLMMKSRKAAHCAIWPHLHRVSPVDYSGDTLLHCAVRAGCEATVNMLLDYGEDINAKNNMGETPLMTAVQKKGNIKIVKLLVERGADVFQTTIRYIYPEHNYLLHVELGLGWPQEFTTLEIATETEDEDIIAFLTDVTTKRRQVMRLKQSDILDPEFD